MKMVTTWATIYGDLYFRARSTPDGMSAAAEVYGYDDMTLYGRKRFYGETAHQDAERYAMDQYFAERVRP